MALGVSQARPMQIHKSCLGLGEEPFHIPHGGLQFYRFDSDHDENLLGLWRPCMEKATCVSVYVLADVCGKGSALVLFK